jgi:hypothetical protein
VSFQQVGWANTGLPRGGEGAAERSASAMLLAGQSRSPDQQRHQRPKATTDIGPCSLRHCSSPYAGTSPSTSLQPKLKLMLNSKYVKACRDGRKWREIRKVTDVGPSFEVGWIIIRIRVAWALSSERGSVIPMQAGFSCRRWAGAPNWLSRDSAHGDF